MEEPTTCNSCRASSAARTVSRRYSKMRPQKAKYLVTTCANIFIASTHMNRGSAYWHSISDSFSYQLAIIKGVIPSSALSEDGGRSESPMVVKVNLFDCGDVGKPVFAAAQFYPGSYSPEDLPPSTDLDRWAAVTAVIITRSPKRQQGQQHADSPAPSSSTLTLTETLAKHDKKSASRWTEVAESVARSRPMVFGNKFLAFELIGGRQWIDGVGLLMMGIVPFAELGSATAVVRAYNSALLFSACNAKSKIMTEASAVSGSDCEGENEAPGTALPTLTLGTPQVRQGLRAVATKTPKTHLVFSFKEKMSFAPPLGIGLAESRILPPTAISPKKVEARIVNTCSLSHHVTCVFFPVTGMDPTNDFAYLALDTWASKASSWLLENTEGRALFDKILEEVPVCGKFLCAAVKTIKKDDPVLGLLLHFHWNPENMKPFYMAVDTAIREAWGALRVSTVDSLL